MPSQLSDLLKSLSIVYAEDDEVVRQGIARALQRRFKQVYQAANGQLALDLIKQHRPDILITDLEMPILDGLRLIKTVRAEYEVPKIIIVVTAYNDEAHHSDLADGYVYKPIHLEKLLDVLMQLITERLSAANDPDS